MQRKISERDREKVAEFTLVIQLFTFFIVICFMLTPVILQ